jgi:hypothetical protein
MRVAIACGAVLLATPALAGFDSVYTDLKFDDTKICTNVSPAPVPGEPEDGAVFECSGYGDYVVTFAEGDLRSYVSFGTESGDHCAARQTFGGFNSVGNKIEWRLKDSKPIATILRWSVSHDPEDSNKQKSWLVVTKLEENDSCHMGYVEGGYPKANEKARWLVDTAAEAFSCKVGKPVFFANPGTVTDGIAANGGCGE